MRGSEQVHGRVSECDASRGGLQKCGMCLGCSAIGAGEIGDIGKEGDTSAGY